MAKCPVCNNDLRTPSSLNLDAWAHLRCTNCQTRLKMAPLRFGVFAVLWAPLFLLARQSRLFESIAFAFMFVTMFLIVLESIHPRVLVREESPLKPEIRLNIDSPSE